MFIAALAVSPYSFRAPRRAASSPPLAGIDSPNSHQHDESSDPPSTLESDTTEHEKEQRLAQQAAARNRLVALAEERIRTEPQSALAWLAQLGDAGVLERVGALLAEKLEGGNPRAILELVRLLPAGGVRQDLLGRQLGAWVDSTFSVALDWARALPEDSFKAQALLHLSYRWQETNVHDAVTYALGAHSTNPQLVTAIVSQWAARDPNAAAAWAAQLADGELRFRIVGSLTAAWARTSPREAAQYAATLPAGEAQTQAVTSALSAWAHQHPAEAAEWVSRFPAGSMQVAAHAHVAYVWAKQDAASAAEWLVGLPEGTAKDAAVSAFASEIVQRYPKVALVIAESIAGDALRHQRIEEAARRLLRTNPDQAAEHIAASSLPPNVVSRLLRSTSAR